MENTQEDGLWELMLSVSGGGNELEDAAKARWTPPGLDLPETTTLENVKEILTAFKAWDTAGAVAFDTAVATAVDDATAGVVVGTGASVIGTVATAVARDVALAAGSGTLFATASPAVTNSSGAPPSLLKTRKRNW